MNLFNWLFRPKKKEQQHFVNPLTHRIVQMPTRNYNKSLTMPDKEAKTDKNGTTYYPPKNNDDLLDPLNPLNPLSPFWIGHTSDGGSTHTPQVYDSPTTNDYTPPTDYNSSDSSSYNSNDSGSSYDSGSSSSSD